MRSHPLLILASVLAVVAFSLLAAGCGGGGSPNVASVASPPTATTTTQSGATPTQAGTLASALAFARCMRSHGIPGWPDPTTDGGFDKSKLRPLGLSVTRVRALEEGPCNIPLPSPQAYTITPADQADYLEAAACMRSHGFPAFPDPTFQGNTIRLNIPTSFDQDSPRFKSAAVICTRVIPAGLPYSSPGGP
jgi:hypothetical protein